MALLGLETGAGSLLVARRAVEDSLRDGRRAYAGYEGFALLILKVVIALDIGSTAIVHALASTVETRSIDLLGRESATCTICFSALLRLVAFHQKSGCLPELTAVVTTTQRYQIAVQSEEDGKDKRTLLAIKRKRWPSGYWNPQGCRLIRCLEVLWIPQRLR